MSSEIWEQLAASGSKLMDGMKEQQMVTTQLSKCAQAWQDKVQELEDLEVEETAFEGTNSSLPDNEFRQDVHKLREQIRKFGQRGQAFGSTTHNSTTSQTQKPLSDSIKEFSYQGTQTLSDRCNTAQQNIRQPRSPDAGTHQTRNLKRRLENEKKRAEWLETRLSAVEKERDEFANTVADAKANVDNALKRKIRMLQESHHSRDVEFSQEQAAWKKAEAMAEEQKLRADRLEEKIKKPETVPRQPGPRSTGTATPREHEAAKSATRVKGKKARAGRARGKSTQN